MSEFYAVWLPEEGRASAVEYEAHAPYMAAEFWADEEDFRTAEYSIVGGKHVIVHVEDDDGNIYAFSVIGETQRVYTATSVSPITQETL